MRSGSERHRRLEPTEEAISTRTRLRRRGPISVSGRNVRRFFGGGGAPKADKLVVGLGNPGDGYANTRHNVGFAVANRLGKRARAEFGVKAADSRIAEGRLDGMKIAIARPQTFLNDSGRAVKKLLDRYRLDPADMLVVFDDVDLPLGTLRIRFFFQAEDGIRDPLVTGVQTCALPISPAYRSRRHRLHTRPALE